MFDESKFFIGVRCRRNHLFNENCGSLRYKSTGQCVECHRKWHKEYSQKEEVKEKKRQDAKKDYYKNRDKILERQSAYRQTQNFKDSMKRSRGKNRNKRLKETREWRAKNKDHISKYNAKYSRANRDKINANAKRRENVDRQRTQAAKYRSKNQDKIKLQQKEYRNSENGKLVRKIAQNKREARKRGVFQVRYTTNEIILKSKVFAETCCYCGSKSKLTLDHFYPLSGGGVDAIYNILPACGLCNTRKSKSNPVKWYKDQTFFTQERWTLILDNIGETERNKAEFEFMCI